MAENTTPAMCSEEEYRAARAAGLLVGTTSDERHIHAFAEAIRRDLLGALRLIDTRLRDHLELPVYVCDVYDSFFQEEIAQAIAKATGSAS
jgi:hypothetical protein